MPGDNETAKAGERLISRSAGALRRQVSIQCRKSLRVDRASIYFEMGVRDFEIFTAIFNPVILTQKKITNALLLLYYVAQKVSYKKLFSY